MPITEPVTLAEVKTFMRIDADYDLEDTLLTEFISTAREYIEEYTGLNLVEREMTFESEKEVFFLPGAPIKSIVSVLDELGEAAIYKLKNNQILTDSIGVTVEYTGGYAVSALPATLKQALKQLVSTMYENREGYSIGSSLNSVSELPFGIKDMLHPYSLRSGLFFM